MEPKIINKPAFTVVGVKYYGTNQNNALAKVWRSFLPRMGQIQDKVNPQLSYGVLGNFNEARGEFDYLAGIEVAKVTELPEGMSSWPVPDQNYAVFATSLPDLMETLDHIYKVWLPQSDYQRGSGPEFELYGEEFNPEDPCSIMYVYIPVA